MIAIADADFTQRLTRKLTEVFSFMSINAIIAARGKLCDAKLKSENRCVIIKMNQRSCRFSDSITLNY
jgi:hypothetical protein